MARTLSNPMTRQTLADPNRRADRHTSSPRYLAIAESLRQQIFLGKLPGATRIDTESTLARQFDVSVGTIRKAQDLLIAQGLLVKRQGNGTYVAPDANNSSEVLWVSGVNIFNNDLSPYFAHYLQYCRHYAAKENLNLRPVLLSNDSPDDALDYCTTLSSRKYLGYIFVGCEYHKHPLLRYANEQQLCYTHVDRGAPTPNKIILAYDQAFETGVTHLLEQGHDQVDVLILDQRMLRELVSSSEPFIQRMSNRLRLFVVPPADRMSEVENNGYQAMRHHLLEQSPASGMLLMDDIMARGATRAMLQHPDKLPANFDLVVMSSFQESFWMGVDATWLLHDVKEEARQTVAILSEQIKHPDQSAGSYVSHFKLKTLDQLDQSLGSPSQDDASMIQPVLLSSPG